MAVTIDLTAVPEAQAGIDALLAYLLAEDTASATDAESMKTKDAAITQLTGLLVKQGDAKVWYNAFQSILSLPCFCSCSRLSQIPLGSGQWIPPC